MVPKRLFALPAPQKGTLCEAFRPRTEEAVRLLIVDALLTTTTSITESRRGNSPTSRRSRAVASVFAALVSGAFAGVRSRDVHYKQDEITLRTSYAATTKNKAPGPSTPGSSTRGRPNLASPAASELRRRESIAPGRDSPRRGASR